MINNFSSQTRKDRDCHVHHPLFKTLLFPSLVTRDCIHRCIEYRFYCLYVPFSQHSSACSHEERGHSLLNCTTRWYFLTGGSLLISTLLLSKSLLHVFVALSFL